MACVTNVRLCLDLFLEYHTPKSESLYLPQPSTILFAVRPTAPLPPAAKPVPKGLVFFSYKKNAHSNALRTSSSGGKSSLCRGRVGRRGRGWVSPGWMKRCGGAATRDGAAICNMALGALTRRATEATKPQPRPTHPRSVAPCRRWASTGSESSCRRERQSARGCRRWRC